MIGDAMMHDMGGEMMWGMGLFGVVPFAVLVLVAIALVKYIFSDKRAPSRYETL